MFSSSKEYFKWSIAYAIHEIVDTSNVCKYDARLRNQFNLVCTMIDRLYDAVAYLNKIREAPKTDNALFLCLMCSCIVHDAVVEIHEALGLKYRYDGSAGEDEYKYFKNVISEDMLRLPLGKSFPTDEKFFKYFRSLAFAHPFETSRHGFLEKGEVPEVRYSPFVINAAGAVVEDKEEQMIGVRVYSNKWNEINDLYFPFRIWMEFLRDRYELLNSVTEEIKKTVKYYENMWRSEKLDRSLSTVELLKLMVDKLRERCVAHSVLETAEDLLAYYTTSIEPFSLKTKRSVEAYRESVKSLCSQLCDAIDNLDYEEYMNVLDPIVNPEPIALNKYTGVDYQLEKIFTHYKKDDYNYRVILESFSKGFSKKWVDIDASVMTEKSVKLLVTVACYHEFSHIG